MGGLQLAAEHSRGSTPIKLRGGSERQSANSSFPGVSVIIPCRNERNHIVRCVESVLHNGYPGEIEAIVVDGMSEDGTRDVIRELGTKHACIRMLDNPRRIAPTAMNIGLRATRLDVVLLLGAHCEMQPGYILTLVSTLAGDNSIGCVGGRTAPQGRANTVQKAASAVLGSRLGVGNSYFRLPGKDIKDVDTVAFGAYRKDVFLAVGSFDERLVRNQDIEFNYRVRKAGFRVLLDPSVEIHYSPRRSWKEFWKQNFGNGLWNIVTWQLVPGALSWRHFMPLFFVAALLGLGVGSFVMAQARIMLWVVLSTYALADILESARVATRGRDFALLASALAFPILHVSYGLGSILGVFHLLARRKGIALNEDSMSSRTGLGGVVKQ